MAKRKLQQYAEVDTFPNVVQPAYDLIQQGHNLKGRWAKDHFGNDNPIVLELGCGKGEYTVTLAEKYPERNFIGVDRKGARIWTGSKHALENELGNVAFLRMDIRFLHKMFSFEEVDEIWITFPDPHPKKPHAKRRLTHPRFLEQYKRVLRPGGQIHLKTDNLALHEFTVEVLESMNYSVLDITRDLYNTEDLEEASSVQTYYERKFLAEGLPITYLRFTLGTR
ncbi:MAG: tRNA (guanosine(46)-N7)-methyltransferase TrmB [Flavobacteriales bacterium]|nr:tRNA (guanosine(46)-N7)-methyltransferase TrmB [Flavobacteriales bacterium]